MSTYRIYPHRTASTQASEVQWWMERDGQRLVCPDVLLGWDYDSSLTVGMTLSIDAERILASTGIERLSSLTGVLQVECKAAQTRFIEHVAFGAPPCETVVEAKIIMPPGSVAGSFSMSAHVVLGEEGGPHSAPRVAVKKGSRLLALPVRTIQLEGDAGRFPTEAVSFRDLGLRNAPWTISLMHEDMGDSFMGAVRLLINTDHPVARQAMNGEDPERFADAMAADLIRLLVAGLSREQIAPEHWESEDSVANVMDSMCSTFLNCSFEEAQSLFRGDPIAFDGLVQQEVNPLQRFIQ